MSVDVRSQDFKTNRELRAIVKIAEKLGTTDMFYTNIETCAYTMPKSPQRKAVYIY